MFLCSYDGNVDDVIDSHRTTHILTTGTCSEILALHDASPQARVVNIEWLDACVTEDKRLNTDIYEL